ncbi:serine/threonine-protein kinase [Streptomyces sp. Y1]|uniref:Serine/threonine-protein kinase n=1 Tax=Streptomyces sp. Y1 TaxID=3238634 RepID=A0AB39TWW4_9ACTN
MSSEVFRFPGLRAHDPDGLGGFRLVARLGEGGMGQVFLALSPGGQPAAVKVIRDEFARDEEFGHRFAREVAAAQRVRGAHLAPLLDADPRAERPWLATAYVAGPSLRDLVVDHGALPPGQVLLLAWGIAHALADIHAARVVHRDLKPGNILLDESGPKVIDFGIVKSLAQSVTYRSRSTRVGTPLYMSPEQAMGRTVGEASDVFALGSTLYYLATGREAFGADNEWAVAHRIVADEPDLGALADPLGPLIATCLRKDPAQRPSAAVVREWCEEALGDALGPGAWMGITGARAAIRARTGALHALATEGGGRGAAPGPVGGSEDETVRGSEDETVRRVSRTRRAPEPPPVGGLDDTPPVVPDRPDRTRARAAVIIVAEALAAAGALARATQLPIAEEFWKSKATGTEVARLRYQVDLGHLWDSVPSGVPDVNSDWVLTPVAVVGTAAVCVLAALSALSLAKGAAPRALGAAAAGIGCLWLLLAGIVGGFVLLMTFGMEQTDDNPAYKVREVLLAGGWFLTTANALAADALRRAVTHRPRPPAGAGRAASWAGRWASGR